MSLRTAAAAAAAAVCVLASGGLTAPAHSTQTQRSRPSCLGRVATIVGTAGDDTVTGTRRADVIVSGAGNDTVEGNGGGDRICTNGGDDTVIGGAGADIMSAGSGSDIVLGGDGGDRMYGGPGMDGLLGMAGDDLYRGDSDLDIAAFLASPQGVTADLQAGRAGGEGQDTLIGVEALMGSAHTDRLRGDARLNVLFSGDGADILDGRDGNDYVLMGGAPGPVEIDLGDDRFTGGGLVPNIENVVGSPFDDTIYGDSGFNYLDGGDGNDSVDGIDGSDLCVAEVMISCRDFPATSEPGVDPGTTPTGGLSARLRAATAPASSPPASPPAAPAPARRVENPTPWGFTSCPMLESKARIGTYLLGTGFFASRSSLGFGDYTNYRYSPWVYFDANNYWVWLSGRWLGPFSKSGAGYYQWTEDIGAANTAYGWFYSQNAGQYYSLGSCNGGGSLPGIFG